MVTSGPRASGRPCPQSSQHLEAEGFSFPATHPVLPLAGSLVQVAMPGTCGELLQGSLDGCPALVSCPIDSFGIAEVRAGEATPERPKDAPKAHAAVRLALAHWGVTDAEVSLRLSSALPRSRGYGSSTADVGAALYGVAAVLGQRVEPGVVASLAVMVEPTDSTVFPGLALLAHKDASVQRPLGPAPDLAVIVVDPGGEVDTLAFNQRDLADPLRRLAGRHREAFELLETGLWRGDLQAVGEAATTSAIAHNEILFHPLLERTVSLSQDVHALGLCRAHSGTLIGVLLDPNQDSVADVAQFLHSRLGAFATVSARRMVSGGARWRTHPHGENQPLGAEGSPAKPSTGAKPEEERQAMAATRCFTR